MHNFKAIALIALGLVFLGCQDTPNEDVKADQETIDTTASSSKLSKEFKEFYNRYHQDSMFQIKRTQFPLAGVPEDRSKADPNFKWEMSNWELHQPFDNIGGNFHRTFRSIGDKIVIEYIYSPKLNLIMERRFQDREDGWHLIYYKALGERHPKQEK